MKRLFLLTPFSLMLFFAYGQSPGNVSSNLQVWLKADGNVYNTGTTQATNGQTVETWDDASSNNRDAKGQTDPVFMDGNAAHNFNPYVDFNGSSQWMRYPETGTGSVWGSTDTDGSAFIVANTHTLGGGWATLFGTDNIGDQNDGDAPLFGRFNSNQIYFNHESGNGKFNTTTPLTANLTLMWEWLWTDDEANGLDMYLNGILSNATGTVTQTNDNHYVVGGETSNHEYHDGSIQEIIIYNTELNSTDRQKVVSYASLKYGVTYNNGSADYLASDGSTKMWDAAVASAHNDDIAGIGRDDDSALNQKQSKSVNSDAIVTVGLGTIAADNSSNANTFSADNQFMTWGNDGAAREESGATTSNLPVNIDRRMTRVWRVEENNGDVGSCQIQFDITGLGYSGAVANNFALLIDDEGSDFSNATVTVASSFSSNIVTFTGINLADADFFTLGESDAILPVEIILFRAESLNNESMLTWETASETNNEGFDIQWSVDGRVWESIGFVKGAGNTYEKQNYSYIHQTPESSINYYRLKQMDFDGAFEYSNTVSIDLTGSQNSLNLKIIPNPVQNGEFTFYIPETELESSSLELFNASGQLILSQPISTSNTKLDVRTLPSGVYWLKVNVNRQTMYKKVMIQN